MNVTCMVCPGAHAEILLFNRNQHHTDSAPQSILSERDFASAAANDIAAPTQRSSTLAFSFIITSPLHTKSEHVVNVCLGQTEQIQGLLYGGRDGFIVRVRGR